MRQACHGEDSSQKVLRRLCLYTQKSDGAGDEEKEMTVKDKNMLYTGLTVAHTDSHIPLPRTSGERAEVALREAGVGCISFRTVSMAHYHEEVVAYLAAETRRLFLEHPRSHITFFLVAQ